MDFGTTGHLVFPGAVSLIATLADSQGRILVGGAGAASVYLGRASGNDIDPSFARSGYAVTAAKAGGAIALQPDGKIVQIGTVDAGDTTRCFILRYLETGERDVTFGAGGSAAIPVDGCTATAVALQSDGKIIIAGARLLRVWP